MKTQATYIHNGTITLESGQKLTRPAIAYTTLGKLNATKDNVIWICHAFSADAHADDWWPGMVGSGKTFDPDKHFIVTANFLGSTYGTTGPLSINPETGSPYYLDFPSFTIRDQVFLHEILRNHLKINQIHTIIGGSMGGMQALEWAIINPTVCRNLVLLATNARLSPWAIALNESQRLALKADASWGKPWADAAADGLKAARSIAIVSYRNYLTYEATQKDDSLDKTEGFRAVSYQNYQGEKFVRRFNAYSYYYITRAMDTHNVGRGRESVEKALESIEARTLLIGIRSDILFPKEELRSMADHIADSTYVEIDSLYGHDGFLLENEQIAKHLNRFWAQKKEVVETEEKFYPLHIAV